MHFVYFYPTTHDNNADMLEAGPVHQVAAMAEKFNFEMFALTEHPAPGYGWISTTGHQCLDPLVSLGSAVATTSRIKLLTHLVVAPYRNPLLLAKAAATLDKLSGGRLVLGLGAGYLQSEFDAVGVAMAERNVLFDEVLDVLPLHWSGEVFSYRGRHFDARDILALPRPVQNPIPIWIGGNARRSRRRVVERARGWMPMLARADLISRVRTTGIDSLDHLAAMIAEMRSAAAARDQSATIDVALAYPDLSIATPTEEVDRHLEALAVMERAGVTHVVISHNSRSVNETFEFVEAFGSTYCDEPSVGLAEPQG